MQIIFFVIFYCAMATGNHGDSGQGAGHGVSYGIPRSSSYLTNFRKFIPYTKKTAGMHEKLMRRMYGIKN